MLTFRCKSIGISIAKYWFHYLGISIGIGFTICEIFNLSGSLFNTSAQSDCPPPSADSISLSLSHLVPEILRPKVGLIFHQNVFCNRF